MANNQVTTGKSSSSGSITKSGFTQGKDDAIPGKIRPPTRPQDSRFALERVRRSPLAIFDSGKGGVYHAYRLRQLLPHEDIVVLADNEHFPFGDKSAAVVRTATAAAVRRLVGMNHGKICNVACHTASIAFRPQAPAFGLVEPAIALALEAAKTQSRPRIGIIGTHRTIRSRAYQRRLAAALTRAGVYADIEAVSCPALVELLEVLPTDSPAAKVIGEHYLKKFHAMPTVLILACSHFELSAPVFRSILASRGGVVIEPSAGLAVRTAARLREADLLNPQCAPGSIEFLTVVPDASAVQSMRALFEELMRGAAPLSNAA